MVQRWVAQKCRALGVVEKEGFAYRRPRRKAYGLAALVVGCLAILFGPFPSDAQDQPGVIVERVAATERRPLPVGDGVITLVRVDLRRYHLRFLTEERHGNRRSAPRWLRDHRLAGVTNAGMFLPNGRSVGHMVQDGTVASARRVSRYRGLVGFGLQPGQGGAPFVVGGGPRGRGCPEQIDDFAGRYRNVLQAYALLDCHGNAVPWRNRMRYSAAGFGVDQQGRAVFMHTRTPFRMESLSRMLAAPALGLRGMIYLEGGPEASLVVDAEGQRVAEMGSYEDGFNENDDNRAFWDLPNVIAFQRR